MALWCRDLLVVTVERSRVPKHVTLIVPYYEAPRFFARQLALWASYPAHLSAHLSIIVVDDGSPAMPAHDVDRPALRDFRLFRIEQDVRWNWLAARNIGFHHAPDGWCLVTDIDHMVPAETLDAVIHGVHDTRIAYAFSRREHTGVTINAHSATFLMTRELFWKVGGYDERCSGFYGTDGMYRRRLASIARMAVLTDVLIRHEYVEDSSVTTYQRKQPEDARLKQLVASFPKHSPPKVLSFPYREVTC